VKNGGHLFELGSLMMHEFGRVSELHALAVTWEYLKNGWRLFVCCPRRHLSSLALFGAYHLFTDAHADVDADDDNDNHDDNDDSDDNDDDDCSHVSLQLPGKVAPISGPSSPVGRWFPLALSLPG
jgi:hypothetical protein